MSTIEVNKITPVSGGTAIQLGESGDTITIPSGATITNSGTANNFGAFTASDITGQTALTVEPASTDEMVLSDSGTLKRLDMVHMMKRPAFRAYRSGTSLVANVTFTVLSLTDETFDTDNCFDSTTNFTFTPGVAGTYFLYGSLRTSSTSAFNNLSARIFKNDTTAIALGDNSNGGENSVNVSSTVLLDADDTAVFKIYQSSGGNLSLYGGEDTVYFGGFRITGGPTS